MWLALQNAVSPELRLTQRALLDSEMLPSLQSLHVLWWINRWQKTSDYYLCGSFFMQGLPTV